MHRNRISREAVVRLPQAPPPSPTPHGFTLCPLSCLPGLMPEQWLAMQWLYQQAFEQAQAVVRPSILERDLLGVWN